MKIKIDGKEIRVKDKTKNIVQIAEENGITIVAPCFRNKKKHGCCNACVIEVENQEKFACGTKPYDGMDITYERNDLKEIREERLKKYVEAIKTGESIPCGSESQKKAQQDCCSDSQSCGCSDSDCCS